MYFKLNMAKIEFFLPGDILILLSLSQNLEIIF